jgi:hypothetical protein
MSTIQEVSATTKTKESVWKSPIFYAALIAAIVSSVSILFQYYSRQEDLANAVRKEIMQQRKEALLQALEVIDNLYANENIEKRKDFIKHPWSIQKARDAMNKMIIYCEDPQTTVSMYREILGVNNPFYEKPKTFRLYNIQDFRVQVAKELHLPPVVFRDTSFIWISRLNGAE